MSRGRILVVEDEPTVRKVFELVLGDAGYEVEAVESGEEGVERVQRTPWNLVFCDFRLPGIDGLETFKRMKAIQKDVPVVIVTAYFHQVEEQLREGWCLGTHDAYLRKPLENEELVKAAEKYVRGGC